MNVVLVEPFFPANQRQFARALAQAGATVIGIGEYGLDALDDELKGWLYHYERVPSVTDVPALTQAVRWVQDKLWVDRLEATVEAHTMAAAEVREACTIPGTSVRTAWLCRDKPSMKEALRAAGVPTAVSAAVDCAAQAHDVRRAGRVPADPQAAQRRRRVGHRTGRRLRGTRSGARGLRRPGRRVGRHRGVRRGARGLLRHDHRRRPGGPGLRLALLPQRARGDADPVDLARSSSPPTGSMPRRSTASCGTWARG